MDIKDFLSRTFLFNRIETENITQLLAGISYERQSFSKGEIIASPSEDVQRIGFVIKGECEVLRSRNENKPIYLNTLSPCSSFGILSILDKENTFPTEIIAKKSSEILFISKNDFLTLIKKDSSIAMNVIEFLAERVLFLNKRISTFSSKSVEEKLADYLIEMSNECNSFTISPTKLSHLLNAGRASIYRILESFSESGLIEIENKKITIKDKNKLKEVK